MHFVYHYSIAIFSNHWFLSSMLPPVNHVEAKDHITAVTSYNKPQETMTLKQGNVTSYLINTR